MVTISFVRPDGARHDVDAAIGESLMAAAVRNGVPGIEGECGGACACATCHVFLSPAWESVANPASDHELAMLDCAIGVTAESRLACQIAVTEAMNGLYVATPQSQR
ncbi:MAG: 2Fe-2S iron-sulfur cluster-binding protein [Hyphomonadaceae bacterium]|nr:2Fe-2S iron-sulfur cluster-binding protein [Hyphomonadaceae bacterium]